MAGYYETQVRRAMLTVGDANVLNEMATGWRTSIRDLNTVDDRLKGGIDGLRDHDQLGDATRERPSERSATCELRRRAAAHARQDRPGARRRRRRPHAGEVAHPGLGPAGVPALPDRRRSRTPRRRTRRRTGRQRTSTAREHGYAQELQQREDEARGAWDSLNRVFGIAEDKIRSAHEIPLEDDLGGTEPPTWPPADWPGPPPENPEPDWPPLPPWPPVSELPDPDPACRRVQAPDFRPAPAPDPVCRPVCTPDPSRARRTRFPEVRDPVVTAPRGRPRRSPARPRAA